MRMVVPKGGPLRPLAIVSLAVAFSATLSAEPPVPSGAGGTTAWAALRAALRVEAQRAWPSFVTSEQGRRVHARVAGAVAGALLWLAAHQSPDGRWEAQEFSKWHNGTEVPEAERVGGPGLAIYDVGVTGLALTAFLVAGYSGSGAHPFDDTVRKGLAYLLASQDPEGCFGPRVVSPLRQLSHYEERWQPRSDGPPSSYRVPQPYAGERRTFVYNHAVATTAMVEAAGLTGDARWTPSAQRALDFIALARNPFAAWRYGVKPGDNDTSVTGWMMLALHTARFINRAAEAAQQPSPFTVDAEAFDGILAWVDRMTEPDRGRVGYTERGGNPSRLWEMKDRFGTDRIESMTAVGVLARILGGEDRRKSQALLLGAALCAQHPPTWNPSDGSIDLIYWHFGTLAVHQLGGCSKGASSAERRRCYDWLQALEQALVEHQRGDGSLAGGKGSWDPIDPWSPAGGRVYSTSIAALTLLTPARFPLPTKAR